MVILRNQNKITDFFMILAWASPFKALWYHDALGESLYLCHSLMIDTDSVIEDDWHCDLIIQITTKIRWPPTATVYPKCTNLPYQPYH